MEHRLQGLTRQQWLHVMPKEWGSQGALDFPREIPMQGTGQPDLPPRQHRMAAGSHEIA